MIDTNDETVELLPGEMGLLMLAMDRLSLLKLLTKASGQDIRVIQRLLGWKKRRVLDAITCSRSFSETMEWFVFFEKKWWPSPEGSLFLHELAAEGGSNV